MFIHNPSQKPSNPFLNYAASFRNGDAEVLSAHPEPVLAFDRQGRLVYANPACFHHFPDLDGADEGHGLLAKFRAEIQTCESERVTWKISSFSAAGIHYRCVVVLSDLQDRACVFMTDISREIELQKRLFERQQKETIDFLAHGIAHDFNNFLSVILSLCELSKDQVFANPGEVADNLDEIEAAARAAADLSKQLSSYCRAKTASESEPVSVNDAVMGMKSLLRSAAGQECSFSFELGEGDARVPIGKMELRQVLMNLVVNARDAMGGKGSIAVTTRRRAKDMVVTVRDDGPGIAPEHRRKIFDPYFTTKEEGKGTGLGLAMCREIVRSAGGEIAVESEVGVGSRFHVIFPCQEVAVVGDAGEPEAAPLSLELPRRNVLIAEDNEIVRNTLKKLLEQEGYYVLLAYDGEEAMRIIDFFSGEIDFVLSDGMMPRLNGFMLYEAVARKYPRLPFVCMTGCEDEIVEREGREHPGLRIFRKPLNRSEIVRIVDEGIRSASRREQAAC